MGTSTYDEVPYQGRAFSSTHPDHLATIALLHGLETGPVETCRALELGCGSGGNLVPMAYSLPEARFVGVDLSPGEIALGRALVERAGTSNVELHATSILDVDESHGRFDYIICHGVYSWVPPEVQDKILAVCGSLLAPNGVAYVSYNTYPGWHARGLVREMMNYHVRGLERAQDRIEQARAFLGFLCEAVPPSNEGYYGRLLRLEAEKLAPAADSYLFHEHLEDVNQPLYFHEFMERASAHGLSYVAEVGPDYLRYQLPTRTRAMLAELELGRLDGEQYLDFILNRTFRRTLLCRTSAAPTRAAGPEVMGAFQYTSIAKPVVPEADVRSDAEVEFVTSYDARTSTGQPLVKAALVALFDAWPSALSRDALWERVRERLRGATGLGVDLDHGAGPLDEVLFELAPRNLVSPHRHVPEFTPEPSERPRASRAARALAEMGGSVTSLRHRSLELDDFERLVLSKLDGSLDRAALATELVGMAGSGAFTIYDGEEAIRDLATIRQAIHDRLDAALSRFAHLAVLEA